jgi:hypothetical protein
MLGNTPFDCRILRTSHGGVPVNHWHTIVNADASIAPDLMIEYAQAEQHWYDQEKKFGGDVGSACLRNRYRAQNCKNFTRAVHKL